MQDFSRELTPDRLKKFEAWRKLIAHEFGIDFSHTQIDLEVNRKNGQIRVAGKAFIPYLNHLEFFYLPFPDFFDERELVK